MAKIHTTVTWLGKDMDAQNIFSDTTQTQQQPFSMLAIPNITNEYPWFLTKKHAESEPFLQNFVVPYTLDPDQFSASLLSNLESLAGGFYRMNDQLATLNCQIMSLWQKIYNIMSNTPRLGLTNMQWQSALYDICNDVNRILSDANVRNNKELMTAISNIIQQEFFTQFMRVYCFRRQLKTSPFMDQLMQVNQCSIEMCLEYVLGNCYCHKKEDMQSYINEATSQVYIAIGQNAAKARKIRQKIVKLVTTACNHFSLLKMESPGIVQDIGMRLVQRADGPYHPLRGIDVNALYAFLVLTCTVHMLVFYGLEKMLCEGGTHYSVLELMKIQSNAELFADETNGWFMRIYKDLAVLGSLDASVKVPEDT